MAFKLDLSKFKKISSDDHKTTLQHPAGHQITIAHKALNEGARKQLHALPMAVSSKEEHPKKLGLAQGGQIGDQMGGPEVAKKENYKKNGKNVPHFANGTPDVQAPDDDSTSDDDSSSAPETEKVAVNYGPPDPGSPLANEQQQAMVQRQNPQDAVTQTDTGTNITGTMTPSDPSLKGGYEQQLEGNVEAANAEGAMGKQVAPIAQQAANQDEIAQKNFNDADQMLEKERQGHIQDIQNGHIDPDKYWENHDKLTTGIGLILGGLGAAHGGNQALQFLNSNIDRSMQAQAQNLNSDQNLLRANIEQFGNNRQSLLMNRIMLNDAMQNKITAIAAKSKDPMAQARAMQLNGQLQSQNAIPIQQAKILQTLRNGAQTNTDPAAYVPYLPGTPEQKTASTKEINDAEELKKLYTSMNGSAADLSGKVLQGLFSPHDRESAINTFAGRIMKQFEGRYNLEGAQKQADALLPKPGDMQSTLDNKAQRRYQLFNSSIQGAASKGLGLDLSQFPSTRIDPPSVIKTRNGVPYQQGQNGWTPVNSNQKAQ